MHKIIRFSIQRYFLTLFLAFHWLLLCDQKEYFFEISRKPKIASYSVDGPLPSHVGSTPLHWLVDRHVISWFPTKVYPISQENATRAPTAVLSVNIEPDEGTVRTRQGASEFNNITNSVTNFSNSKCSQIVTEEAGANSGSGNSSQFLAQIFFTSVTSAKSGLGIPLHKFWIHSWEHCADAIVLCK